MIKPDPKIGRRAMATLIDYLLYGSFFIWMSDTYGTPREEGGTSMSGWPALATIAAWFIYFPVVESFRGQTPGKLLMRLRVITQRGNAVSLAETIKRHFVDFIDFAFFGIVAIILVKNNPYSQRLGDVLAKTLVVGGDTVFCAHCHQSLEISADEMIYRKFQCPLCHTDNVYTQDHWQVTNAVISQ